MRRLSFNPNIACHNFFRNFLTLRSNVERMKYPDQVIPALLAFLLGIFSAPKIFSLPSYFLSVAVILFGILFRLWPYSAIFFALGLARFFFSFPLSSDHISRFNDTGEAVTFEGIVIEEPDRREFSERLVIRVLAIWRADSRERVFVKGRVLALLPRYPEHRYGNRLELSGALLSPESFSRPPPSETPSENFSYADYLSRYNIYSVIQKPRVSVLAEGKGNMFFAFIYRIKESIETKLNSFFPEPHASFSAGLLLGSRRGLPSSLVDAFNVTGLTHIVAVSGYNITLVIMFISGLLKGFRRKYQVLASTVAIGIFVILVGASAASVRAAVMGVLGLFALWAGRKSEAARALLLSAFFMTLWNPKILVFDTGFHLSLSATAGLIYFSDHWKRWLSRIPSKFGIRETLAMTLSAQTLALPIILLNFQRMSFISPLANLLVAHFIPLAMLFGFLAVAVGFFSNFLGFLVSYVGWLWLEVILKIVWFLQKIPGASIDVLWFRWWFMIVYYAALGFFLFRTSKQERNL